MSHYREERLKHYKSSVLKLKIGVLCTFLVILLCGIDLYLFDCPVTAGSFVAGLSIILYNSIREIIRELRKDL